MRFYACTQCRRCYQVGGGLEEVSSLLKDESSFECITNFCEGRIRAVKAPVPGCQMVEVPIRSFYRAINGFGLASGDPASAARFVEVIKTKRIVNAVVEPVGQPERVIVRQLICEDGTRLHFDTSARGACCYFIEEVGPSCLEVFDAQSVGDAEDVGRLDNQSGEEAGRAPSDLSDVEDADGRSEPANDADAPEQSGAASVPSVSAPSAVPGIAASRNEGGGPDVRMPTPSNPVTNTRSSQ